MTPHRPDHDDHDAESRPPQPGDASRDTGSHDEPAAGGTDGEPVATDANPSDEPQPGTGLARPAPPETTAPPLFPTHGGPGVPVSEAEIRARAECERKRAGLQDAVDKAVDRVSKTRAKVLDQVDVMLGYRAGRRRMAREAQRARADLDREVMSHGPVRQLPTWALLAGTGLGVVLEWFVDQGALEGLLYLPATATKVIALIPVVISVGTAHLYGKYAKHRHLAIDDLLVGRFSIALGRAMLMLGLVTAVVIGTIRGILGGPLSGALFLVAAVGLWTVIAYMAYLWESPQDTRLNRAERRTRHFERTERWAAKRKRRMHGRYVTARRAACGAAASGIESVRHVFRVTFQHFGQPLDPAVATPEWAKPWIPLAEDRFPPHLDLTDDQLDPPDDDDDGEADRGSGRGSSSPTGPEGTDQALAA